jgi:hypothetical protein
MEERPFKSTPEFMDACDEIGETLGRFQAQPHMMPVLLAFCTAIAVDLYVSAGAREAALHMQTENTRRFMQAKPADPDTDGG